MMLKRLIVCLVLASPLAACNTPDPAQVTATVASVQAATRSACNYLPTASTIASLLSASPVVASATALATAICNAVTVNPLADGPGPANYKPTLYGVTIEGKFVK